MENKHPKDWNECAEWAIAGLLEVGEPLGATDRHWIPTGKFHSTVGLLNYRRKPEPQKPLEFWGVFEQLKSESGRRIRYCYESKFLADNCGEKDTIHFREVVERPKLSDEEVSSIAYNVHGSTCMGCIGAVEKTITELREKGLMP